ncbi:MAG: hypothetical protein N0A24_11380 [Armatimonadetes bacterium]|nr:hypothetical protein [Armatimonadota bacterium]MDW8154778.1 hypothetical protein [Armatimonadota bacterium]
MSELRNAGRLCGALLWRVVRDQRQRLLLAPLGYGILALTVMLLPVYLPGGPQTAGRLREGLGILIGPLPDHPLAVALALVVVQGPYLVGVLASVAGAVLSQATVTSETARGGLELLLSAPYRPREVFAAFLVSSFLLVVFSWAVLTAVAIGLPLLMLAWLGAPRIPSFYVGIALFVPLPMALWADLIASAVTLAFPSLGLLRVGTGSTLGSSLAIAPAMGALLFVTIRPEVHPAKMGGVALLLGLGAVGLGLVLFSRVFRVGALLEGL